MTEYKPIIIESPYAGDVEKNQRYLNACIRDAVLNHGETPYASHRMLTGALDDLNKEEREIGISAGLEMTQHLTACCNAIPVFYLDEGFSPGMRRAADSYKTRKNLIELRSLGPDWDK